MGWINAKNWTPKPGVDARIVNEDWYHSDSAGHSVWIPRLLRGTIVGTTYSPAFDLMLKVSFDCNTFEITPSELEIWEEESAQQLIPGLEDTFKAWGNSSNECDHKWKTYQGLQETYEYCSKCDKKRE